MSADLFSAEGIAAWRRLLDASPEFAAAAAGWRGSLVLVESAGAGVPGRATWVVVDDGRCTEVRPATGHDHDAADFVLAANAATWGSLVAAETSPAVAAMRGALRLLRGDLTRLIPHARAAAALLATAARREGAGAP